ncbi:MAG: VOC family protein [Gemmatimonadaceae bacterium]|nr:VOC family protein [Gemmatimonadaceae bacterium]
MAILQNHYVLAVHDLRGSAQFLVDALQFEIVNEPPGWIFVARDNCMIMLGQCPASIPAAQLGDHSYFGYLRVDDVDAVHREMVARGFPPDREPEDKPWEMREFGVRTPEGHRLQVGQYTGT